MIVNEQEIEVHAPRPAGASRDTADVFLAAARGHPASFLLVDTPNGLEITRTPSGASLTSRAFMKVCSVRPGHTLVFFYKRSLLPFSRDRFSYGGIEWRDEQVRPEHARAGLDFLASGLNPTARPAWLRRSLPITVPD